MPDYKEKVRQRAYEIFRARQLAGARGDASQDWQQAEYELMMEKYEKEVRDCCG